MQVSVEEYGSSAMARRFGVRRYPVVFVDDVLPAYLAAIAPPATTAADPAAARVTITLVRWPYT